MNYWIYDIETYRYEWVIVFIDADSDETHIFHNDNEGIRNFLNAEERVLVGFNNKRFDDYLIKAMILDHSPEVIKEISDFIIVEKGLPWEHWALKGQFIDLATTDMRDDMSLSLSLKSIEGHLGLPIVESSVPFDIDRPLTESELEETIQYCISDVKATKMIFELRKNYLETKIRLAGLGNLKPTDGLSMTNAKVTAAYLGAKPKGYTDERNYEYPDNLDRTMIAPEVFEFFNQMYDKSISDEDLFSSKLDLPLGGITVTYGFGGLHGAIDQYLEESEEGYGKRIIRNFDVASLYPSIMLENKHVSRNISDPEKFRDVYNTRLHAKHTGDKVTSDTLKLVLNTTYGAMLNKHNDLYDPKSGRSVCIDGQLHMTELANSYLQECKTIRLIQINTDGIMFSIDEDEMDLIYYTNMVWEMNTGFVLEEDKIKRVYQKDVNNYLMMTMDGHIKVKGGYLSYGLNNASFFNVNNNATIVAQALKEYLAHDTPIEETINASNDPLEFQFITHAGSSYKEVYQQTIDGELMLNKTNRVYASKDKSQGTLYKRKPDKKRGEKIANLPEHCLIDNEATACIDLIDKDWYIDLAKRRLEHFLGGNEWQQMTLKI